MKPVELEAAAALQPDAKYVVIAKDQPQYDPLPAICFPDGKIMTEWSLTEEERSRLISGENIRLWIWSFGQPLQPIALEVTDESKA